VHADEERRVAALFEELRVLGLWTMNINTYF